MKNGDQPAYPTSKTTIVHTDAGNAVQAASKVAGLTKREWFMGMAMQGMLANPNIIKIKWELSTGYRIEGDLAVDKFIAKLVDETLKHFEK